MFSVNRCCSACLLLLLLLLRPLGLPLHFRLLRLPLRLRLLCFCCCRCSWALKRRRAARPSWSLLPLAHIWQRVPPPHILLLHGLPQVARIVPHPRAVLQLGGWLACRGWVEGGGARAVRAASARLLAGARAPHDDAAGAPVAAARRRLGRAA